MKVMQKFMVLMLIVGSGSMNGAAAPKAGQGKMTIDQMDAAMNKYVESLSKDKASINDIIKCVLQVGKPKVFRFIDLQIGTPLKLEKQHIDKVQLILDTLLSKISSERDEVLKGTILQLAPIVVEYARIHNFPAAAIQSMQEQIKTVRDIAHQQQQAEEKQAAEFGARPEANRRPRGERLENPDQL